MICKNCGSEISDTAKFCPKCGAKVEFEKQLKPKIQRDVIICKNCGEINPSIAKFCKKCGTPLKEKIAPVITKERIKRPSKIWIWITAICGLILVIGGIGSYLYLSEKIIKKPTEATSNQEISGNKSYRIPEKSEEILQEFIGRFKGSIGNYKIQMELYREGNNLKGTYFYEKIGNPLYLKGRIDDTGNFKIEEFDEKGKHTGTFIGKFIKEDTLSGVWRDPDGKRELPFFIQLVNENF